MDAFFTLSTSSSAKGTTRYIIICQGNYTGKPYAIVKPNVLGVGSLHSFMPYIILSGPVDNPNVHGIMLEVLATIFSKIGYCPSLYLSTRVPDSYEFVGHRNMVMGRPLPNGSWNGAGGLLQRREIDMTAMGLVITWERYQAFDVSEYLFMDELSAASARPRVEPHVDGFLRPFALTMWMMILLITLAMFVSSCVIRAGYANITEDDNNEEEIHCGIENGGRRRFLAVVVDSVYWTVNPLLSQGASTETFYSSLLGSAFSAGYKKKKKKNLRIYQRVKNVYPSRLSVAPDQAVSRTPRGDSVRLISIVWLLICLILTTIYRSTLKAMLVLPKVSLPFNSLEQLVETGLPVWVSPLSALHVAATDSPQNSTLGKLSRQFIMDNHSTIGKAVEELIDGKHVFAAPRSAIIHILHGTFSEKGRCTNYVMSEGFLEANMLSFIFPKGSPLKAKVDPLITRLRETGILNHAYKRGVVNATECLKPIANRLTNEIRILSLSDFVGVFLLYIGGIASSALAFILENIVGSFERTRRGIIA
ncbi:glutamate receptor ionotropic, kainate 5-like [Penaeus chinensis]|uniref:glutamate receptor ionotropic, kainate 5-like n=1 Tax=Penaeus chinensis TaxID=139456 RepID=UPI001FB79DEB|nr:glutamate receptor ionotropic, kainate 5-like [Penaeus chinensis]